MRMDSNTSAQLNQDYYQLDRYNQSTSMVSKDPNIGVKYIMPRAIKPVSSTDPATTSRSKGWLKVGSNFPMAAKTHGLASLVQNSTFSTIPAIKSINGDCIIDEQRELAKVTEELGNVIVKYCTLTAHNRFRELQIHWFMQHRKETSSVIDKMYKTEIESAKSIIQETAEQNANLDRKLSEASKTIKGCDTQYAKLLERRTEYSQDLFNQERNIAQNNAESQFLRRRITYFEEHNKFYLFRNQVLHDRKARLRCELDEEIFTQHSLKVEYEILLSEKLTKHDIHATSLDEVQNLIDVGRAENKEPWKYYADELSHEVQRIRAEYHEKLDVFREELHRKFELELYRYQIHKANSSSNVVKEHFQRLEQYQRDKAEAGKQLAILRTNIGDVTTKINALESQLMNDKLNQESSLKQKLEITNQMIQDREKRLQDVMQERKAFKQRIETYKLQVERFSKQPTEIYSDRRSNIYDGSTQPKENYSDRRSNIYDASTQPKLMDTSNIVRSYQPLSEPPKLDYQKEQTPSIQKYLDESLSKAYAKSSSNDKNEELGDERTLNEFPDFNVETDCDQLYKVLSQSPIDELALIQILCNRSVNQRLEIRETYKQRFNQNLGDDLEKIKDDNLSKLLRVLLLSPVERDCYGLRRIFKMFTLDDMTIAEIFFTRSNQEILELQNRYKKLFKNSIEQDLNTIPDTPAKNYLLGLATVKRPETQQISHDDIFKDAERLSATASTWRRPESTLLQLLCSRSNLHLKKVFDVYQQFAKIDIEQEIQMHIDGDLGRILLSIVRMVRDKAKFFALEIKKNFKGTVTVADNISRIIVSRCEIDAARIKVEFEKLTKHSLYDYIQLNTNKNYRQALIELLRHRVQSDSTQSKSDPWKQEAPPSDNNDVPKLGVHWRDPIIKSDATLRLKHRLARSTSENFLEGNRENESDQELSGRFNFGLGLNDQSQQPSTTYTKSFKSPYNNRRSFIPMATTFESQNESS